MLISYQSVTCALYVVSGHLIFTEHWLVLTMEGPRLNLTMKDFIWPYEEPPVFEAFWFEKFNVIQCRLWMEKNWTISVYICTAYLLLLYFGKKIMKQRQAFDLQKPLTYWNAVFALFSLIGLIRCTPELARVLQGPNGFHRSVCVRDGHNEPAAFWVMLIFW